MKSLGSMQTECVAKKAAREVLLFAVFFLAALAGLWLQRIVFGDGHADFADALFYAVLFYVLWTASRVIRKKTGL